MELSRALGKTPVEVNDYPGFVANRVLMPMINEAIFCVMEGVATPEAIDTVMKLGMAHPMGPLALADFIGLDVCLAILEVLHGAWATTSTGPVRCCGAWWRLGISGGRAARASTTTSDVSVGHRTVPRLTLHATLTEREIRPRAGRHLPRSRCGYVGIIAIHDTTLGPALGGTRLWNYAKHRGRDRSTRCGWRAA